MILNVENEGLGTTRRTSEYIFSAAAAVLWEVPHLCWASSSERTVKTSGARAAVAMMPISPTTSIISISVNPERRPNLIYFDSGAALPGALP